MRKEPGRRGRDTAEEKPVNLETILFKVGLV